MKIILKNLLKKIEVVKFIGNENTEVEELIQLNPNNSNKNVLFWCNNKNLHKLKEIKTGTIIVSNDFESEQINNNCNYIIVENPRLTFQKILNLYFVEKQEYTVSSSAQIHENVVLKENIFIGHNVIIEKDCEIDENSVINHNTVILRGTKIGKDVVIGSNNTIGGVGFGYEKDKTGKFVLIPHIGNVVIEDKVEIGNNTCIDRAVLRSTILKENCKIDNLVHIAHGVVVGKNSVVIANAMVGGSTIIGDNVWVAPSASLLNKITIDNNSLVGMAANVVKNVNEYEVVAGNPAKVLKKFK